MPSDNIQICTYTSGDPRGQFLDLMKFVKNELRSIGALAQERQHHCTFELTEETITVLDKMWDKAIQKCKDPAEPYPSEKSAKLVADFSDYVMFEMMVKRHWHWLYENWHSILPKT